MAADAAVLDDIWTFPAAGTDPDMAGPAPGVRMLSNVQPLDAQIGIEPKQMVPEALRGVLFGPVRVHCAGNAAPWG